MRERVEAAGGSLVAGPDRDGFWLRATLPRCLTPTVAAEDPPQLADAPQSG
jgi:hypothetical protein